MIEELEKELLELGFLSAEIEELEEFEQEESGEEIWVKVRFKWKWKDKDDIHTDGRQEFHTSYEYAIHEIMAFVHSTESFRVLL